MEVLNALVTKANREMNSEDWLMVHLNLKTINGTYEWNVRLCDRDEAFRLEEIMRYVGAKKLEEMAGKVLRVVIHNGELYGFGNPIEELFISVFSDEEVRYRYSSATLKRLLEEYLKKKMLW